MIRVRRVGVSVVFLCACAGLVGCSLATTAPATPVAGAHLQGVVHGGQNPVSGAHVYLYAANTTGYNTTAATYGSVSLLQSTSSTPPTVGATTKDSNGNYYVTSDANGNFSITGDYTCTPDSGSVPGQQVYLYATGGNAGGGTNSSLGLMAVLGDCPAADNFTAAVPSIVVNEVSTVAAAYAMAGFAYDATHVSSSATVLAETGVKNAFANAANLAALNSGIALAVTPNGTFNAPQSTVNTLADILAACVNSSGSSSTGCSTLFANAKSGGSTGNTAGDTATAAINIAHNPGANIAVLYGNPTPVTPFGPTLGAQPSDFTLALTMIAPTVGLNQSTGLALDGSGNSWVAGLCVNAASRVYACLIELSSSGAMLSSSAGYSLPSGTSTPTVAVDPFNNIWVGGQSFGLIEYSNAGLLLSPANGYTVCCGSSSQIAFDAAGDAWVPYGGSTIGEFSGSGGNVSPAAGYPGGTLAYSLSNVAIDGSGDAWITNYTTSSYTSEDVIKMSPTGTVLSGNGYGFSTLSNSATAAPVIDASGNIWFTNQKTSSLIKMSNAGTVVSGAGYTGGGLYTPISTAVDGAGNVWIGNTGPINQSLSLYTNPTVSEFSNGGVAISPSGGYAASASSSNPNLCSPVVIAVDGSGNVWIANNQYNYKSTNHPVTELIGAAVPVITPIAAGLPTTLTSNGTSNLGTRP